MVLINATYLSHTKYKWFNHMLDRELSMAESSLRHKQINGFQEDKSFTKASINVVNVLTKSLNLPSSTVGGQVDLTLVLTELMVLILSLGSCKVSVNLRV